MLRAIRRWFREESLGITIPVGVVLGLTSETFIAQIVQGFEFGHDPEISPLEISLYYPGVLAYAIALLVLLSVAYVVFVMPIPSDDEPEPDTRECPECKSDIAADARRCAFCTSMVVPLETSA